MTDPDRILMLLTLIPAFAILALWAYADEKRKR